MDNLAPHFIKRLPDGMSYSDAKILCFWLFLTADGIPKAFHPQLTRQGLADMFAKLAHAGWIRQSNEQFPITQSSHWDELILSTLTKRDFDTAEGARARELVKSFGFCDESPAA